jgi:hypothetical protein
MMVVLFVADSLTLALFDLGPLEVLGPWAGLISPTKAARAAERVTRRSIGRKVKSNRAFKCVNHIAHRGEKGEEMAETGWWMMQTVPTLDRVIPEAAICCLTAKHHINLELDIYEFYGLWKS